VNREGIPSRRSFVNSLSVRRTVSSLGYIPLNWHLFAWWMAASPTSILRGWLLSLAFQNASSPCVRDDGDTLVHLSIVEAWRPSAGYSRYGGPVPVLVAAF
jgi:hypothetical protein